MALTTYLGELLGLFITLVGLVMFFRPRTMRDLLVAFVDQRPLLFLLATLRVLIGLAIILGHHWWPGTVPTIVTVIGWISLLSGIAIWLMPPEAERKTVAYFQRSGPYCTTAMIAIVLGLWLAYAGFVG